MNFKIMNRQRKFILIASASGIVSAFLPWANICVHGISKIINGFHGYGILVFIIFVCVSVIVCAENLLTVHEKNLLFFIKAAGAMALYFIISEIITFSEIMTVEMGFAGVNYKPGIWVATGTAITIVLSATLCKRNEQKVKNETKGFKRSISIPATAVPGKKMYKKSSLAENEIIGLDNLTLLKENGSISEEEFQQLKSKLIISNLLFGFSDLN